MLLEPTAGLTRCAATSCALGPNMACSNLTPWYVLWNVGMGHVELEMYRVFVHVCMTAIYPVSTYIMSLPSTSPTSCKYVPRAVQPDTCMGVLYTIYH